MWTNIFSSIHETSGTNEIEDRMLACYLIDVLSGGDGDDILLPRTIAELCNGEFAPEAESTDPTAPWFDTAKLLGWEGWYPIGNTSWPDPFISQSSRGL